MFNLTENEKKVLVILTASCLYGMGGARPLDLDSDPYTWVDPKDLKKVGYTPKQCSGFFSSLIQKGIIAEYDDGEWFLTDEAYRFCETIWDEFQEKIND